MHQHGLALHFLGLPSSHNGIRRGHERDFVCPESRLAVASDRISLRARLGGFTMLILPDYACCRPCQSGFL